MSFIVADELIDELTQEINLTYDKIYHIGGIKIKLLMFNNPGGTFTLSIKDGATTLASESFTSADIKSDLSTTDNYAYLYKALNFSLPLKKGSYDLVLSASGYNPTDSSFLGWIKSFENIFNAINGSPTSLEDNPFDVLIYENTREDLTR